MMKLYAVKYAESTYGEDRIFRGGRKDAVLPLDFAVFLIDTGEKRILVDAGCDTMPGWDMRFFESPAVILERGGFPCRSITDVIITHAHHDHIDAVRHFPRAVVHIQKDEYNEGKRYIPEGFSVDIFEDELEMCCGIRAIKIAGHSAGSCIVTFPMGERVGVISGDEIYNGRSLKDRIPVGNSRNPEKSLAFVEEYSRDRYDVTVMHEAKYLPGRNGIQLIYDSTKCEVLK